MKLYIVHITYFLLLMVCDGYRKMKSVRVEDGGSIVVFVVLSSFIVICVKGFHLLAILTLVITISRNPPPVQTLTNAS